MELQQKYIIMQHDCFDRKYRLGYTFYRCRTKKLKAERCRVRTDADIGGSCGERDILRICRGNIAGAGTEKRVIWHNLIGEHTDYNGGHVFPCALDIGTYAAVKKREDRKLRFASVNIPQAGITEVMIDDLDTARTGKWADYPKGVVWAFEGRGYKLDCGFDMAIYGDIPNGAGLSSSAALEVVTGFALRALYGFDQITNEELALIGQYSENNYNGMNCGIMDQFASAMGKENNAIFLDTNTMKFEYAPIKLDGMKLLITNTNKKHSLVDSEYNARRAQCAEALKDMQAKYDIKALGELSIEQFEADKDLIKDDVCRRRAKHAVYENQRTIEAVQALKDGNVARFGELMNQSHVSLRDDYETSCRTSWRKKPGRSTALSVPESPAADSAAAQSALSRMRR